MSHEILAPPLLRVGQNRCYRVNIIHDDFGNQLAAMQRQHGWQNKSTKSTGYVEQDLFGEDDDDEDELAEKSGEFTIEELPNSMYKLTMHVAPAFYGGIVGFKGITRRRIEGETNTELYIPRQREGAHQSDELSIKGKTRSSVCAARRKINHLIVSLRKRTTPTHFVCVPLNYGEIRDNFNEFKKQVLASYFPGVDEPLFQVDNCIHLTLGTCVLMDVAERTKAVEMLQSCSKFLNNLRTPFDICLRGLEIMNDDPSAVRILYACVEAPDLQKFADTVWQFFKRSGLGSDKIERETIKLHMTVMNSRYGKQQEDKKPRTFDAREILKRYGNFNFGRTQCSEVHLCVMRVPGEAREFYKISGTLKF